LEAGKRMDKLIWEKVDHYFNNYLIDPEPMMDAILQANKEANLPAIDVSPTQGKFLYLLAKMKGAKNILEIGTLGGYSTVWLARALPEDGQIFTLEYSEKHAKVAKENIRKAGFGEKVEIMVGPALDSLATINHSFDFIFIDADKPNNPNYLKWALKLSKPGTVIVADNVVREGKVTEEQSEDPKIQGIRAFIEMLSKEGRVEATGLQTVGQKGYDGMAIAIVKE
jgi:predicted O-methyltransferase YrrM